MELLFTQMGRVTRGRGGRFGGQERWTGGRTDSVLNRSPSRCLVDIQEVVSQRQLEECWLEMQICGSSTHGVKIHESRSCHLEQVSSPGTVLSLMECVGNLWGHLYLPLQLEVLLTPKGQEDGDRERDNLAQRIALHPTCLTDSTDTQRWSIFSLLSEPTASLCFTCKNSVFLAQL